MFAVGSLIPRVEEEAGAQTIEMEALKSTRNWGEIADLVDKPEKYK